MNPHGERRCTPLPREEQRGGPEGPAAPATPCTQAPSGARASAGGGPWPQGPRPPRIRGLPRQPHGASSTSGARRSQQDDLSSLGGHGPLAAPCCDAHGAARHFGVSARARQRLSKYRSACIACARAKRLPNAGGTQRGPRELRREAKPTKPTAGRVIATRRNTFRGVAPRATCTAGTVSFLRVQRRVARLHPRPVRRAISSLSSRRRIRPRAYRNPSSQRCCRHDISRILRFSLVLGGSGSCFLVHELSRASRVVQRPWHRSDVSLSHPGHNILPSLASASALGSL